jgi:hypothetical protein
LDARTIGRRLHSASIRNTYAYTCTQWHWQQSQIVVGNVPRPLHVKNVVCRISAGGVGLFWDLRWKRPFNSSQMCSMGFKSLVPVTMTLEVKQQIESCVVIRWIQTHLLEFRWTFSILSQYTSKKYIWGDRCYFWALFQLPPTIIYKNI